MEYHPKGQELVPLLHELRCRMLSGVGSLVVRGDEERPDKVFVYIPIEVARDSAFPFGKGEALRIRVELGARPRMIIDANP